MSGYEITTMGDLTIPPIVKQAGETLWDWTTSGPIRRWVAEEAGQAAVFAKKELADAQTAAGKALDRYDPRVMFMRAFGAPDAIPVFQYIGKGAVLASVGLLGYAIFTQVKRKRR